MIAQQPMNLEPDLDNRERGSAVVSVCRRRQAWACVGFLALAGALASACSGEDDPRAGGAVTAGDAAARDAAPALRSAEGQYCSATPDDDPFYGCLSGLTCVTTSGQPVLEPDGGAVTVRPVYLCRFTCDDTHPCFQAMDVCCHGTGASGGAARACVPSALCEQP
jgi:hypothetical protein